MIVQVTNSGDDVRPHQFDLQILVEVSVFSTHANLTEIHQPRRAGCSFRFDWV